MTENCGVGRAFKGVWRMMLIVLLTLLAGGIYALATPTQLTVTVMRSDNNKALADAIVKVAMLSNTSRVEVGLTDADGKYKVNFTEPVIVSVSYIGFNTLTDTIYTLQDKTYNLIVSSKDVQDVVVTGQYAPGSAGKSLYEVKVINNDMIRARGANNLREALQNEININLGQDQVFGSSLSINGLSGEGIKILVDGLPITGRLDGKLDLSQININNIERIEIVEGPLSVIYGSDAMGGVINLITRNFQRDKVNINLKGYYESVGQYNVELNGGFAFKKNQVYLSGGRNFFDGFTTLDTIPRFQEWKPREQYFADAKYIYSDKKFRISLLGSFFRELMLNRSAPKEALSFENSDTAWTYVGDDFKYLTYRPRASLSMMYRFKEDFQLDVLAGYSGFFRFTNKYSKNLVTGKEQLVDDYREHDTTRYHQALVRATYTMPAWKNRISFLFGIEANNEITTQTNIKSGTQRLGEYAAFASVRFTITEGLDVQPAARIIYNTRFRAPIVPSVNLKYSHKDWLTFRASYGNGYRAPSLKELYMEFFDNNHALKGNPDLKPEKGHTINGSFDYRLYVGKDKKNRAKAHTVIFGVSGFYNNINDKIDWRLFNAPFPPDTYQYFNIKKYITYGGDVSLGYTWKRLQVNTSGLITCYELGSSSGGTRTKMKGFDFAASAGYAIPKAEIMVNVMYKYNGAKPLFSIDNAIQAGTRAAYHTIDVSLSRNFWKDRIQLTIGGKNLAGVKNVRTTGLSSVGHTFNANEVNIGWGRTFFTTLLLHFSK